jgi:hypothetical protein
METLYEHAGEQQALDRFAAIFYASLLRDPLPQPIFGGAGKSADRDAFVAELRHDLDLPTYIPDRLAIHRCNESNPR